MRPLQMIFAIVFWLLAPLGFAQTVGGVWEDSGSFTGPNADSQQGSVLVNAGDLDGDGLDDLLIGDPMDSTSANRGGSVEARSSATGQLIWKSTGTRYRGFFGYSIDSIGDLNGDGISDVVVGEPRYSTRTGTAHLLSGSDGSSIARVPGTQNSGRFGTAVCGMGDLDQDGLPDIAVSSPGILGVDSGEVQLISGANRSSLNVLTLPHLINVGESISAVGDMDADGSMDLLVFGREDLNTGTGDEAHIFSGASGSSILQIISARKGSLRDAVGVTLGDVDGDGLSDFAIGAPNTDLGSGPDTGLVVAYSGGTGHKLWQHKGDAPGGNAGASLSQLADQNADGVPDLLVGQPFTAMDAMQRVCVVSGMDGQVLRSLSYHSPGSFSQFGSATTSLGVSANGRHLIAVGAPHAESTHSAPGETHLFEWNPILTTNRDTLSAGTGGIVELKFDFPASEGGKAFGLLISGHGIGPGALNGVQIPLHQDWMFRNSIQGYYSPFFLNPMGSLDVAGRASVTFDAPRAGLANQQYDRYWAAVVSLDSFSGMPAMSSVAATLLIEEPDPMLDVPNLVAGQPASLQLTNAYPLEMAYFLHGDGSGNDPFVALGIADSGLTNPQLIGAVTTDISGAATQIFSVPAGTAGQTYWISAHLNIGTVTISDVSGPHIAQ